MNLLKRACMMVFNWHVFGQSKAIICVHDNNMCQIANLFRERHKDEFPFNKLRAEKRKPYSLSRRKVESKRPKISEAKEDSRYQDYIQGVTRAKRCRMRAQRALLR